MNTTTNTTTTNTITLKICELTDEEIKEIATKHIHMTLGGERFGYIEFARAILKKAQDEHSI